jgi:hypothetical protein
MLNRNHLHLSSVSQYIKPGNQYILFMERNNTIELLTSIVIIILMGMITIILLAFFLVDPDTNKKVKGYNKNK